MFTWTSCLYLYDHVQGFLSYLHILPNPKKPLPILQDLSGIIKPGRWAKDWNNLPVFIAEIDLVSQDDIAFGATEFWEDNIAFSIGWTT